MIRRAALLLLGMLLASGAGAQTLWVEANGRAAIHAPDDRDAARRRALADALVSAALMGGAQLSGYSAMDRGTMVSDVTLLRPAGRVLTHTLLEAREIRGEAVVRIAAEVGPLEPTLCDPDRPSGRLLLVAEPPRYRSAPDVPAWGQPLVQHIALGAMEALSQHPAIDLREASAPLDISAGRQHIVRRPVELDYTSLVSGRVAPQQNETHVQVHVELRRASRNDLELTVDLVLSHGPGRTVRHSLRRETRLPGVNRARDIGTALRARRPDLEHDLSDGVLVEVSDIATQLTCAAPNAPLIVENGALVVHIGRDNGLSPSALAFLDDREASFGVFEITDLRAGSARLRPLDPTQAIGPLAGHRVRFIETGS